MTSFTLQRYETGWDKSWIDRDGVLEIQAHAPSTLVLKAAKGGIVHVRAKVKEGGKRETVVLVNRKVVAYEEEIKIQLRAGKTLQLEARVQGGKDQCWNYWEIEGAAIALSTHRQVSFWSGAHLGDSLGMLIASENFARANQITLEIRTTPLFQQIADLFVFEHIRLVPDSPQMTYIHPFGTNFEELGWIKGIIKTMQTHLGGDFPPSVVMPSLRSKLKPEKENVTLVQFDGRSGGRWSLTSLKEFLRMYSGSKIAVIGGPDTTHYLGENVEYRKGDLSFIVQQLLACERFVGTDSGIAHLACILGLKTDLLPSPAVDKKLVRGVFKGYPQEPNFRTITETRQQSRSAHKLLLVSTTNGWNLGDDLIREGVFSLLDIKDRDPVIWINRCQVASEDKDRKCDWSPLWKRLRNFGDPRSLVENARALVVAGTPEWIDTIQPFYRLAAETGMPIWIVGVGGGQQGQLQHIEAPYAEDRIQVATVRDEEARKALASCGIASERFFDPAFHSDAYLGTSEDLFLFNPRLQCSEHHTLYLELYKRFRDHIDLVVVHEAEEYTRACELFDKPVFYNSDYRRYITLYRSCQIYVGGRMHGAIPSMASGAMVHLICHEHKHTECDWLKQRLDQPEALTLWSVSEAPGIVIPRMKGRFDNRRCIQSSFEAHRSYLQKGLSIGM